MSKTIEEAVEEIVRQRTAPEIEHEPARTPETALSMLPGKSFDELSQEAEELIVASYSWDFNKDPAAADYLKERNRQIVSSILYNDKEQLRKGYETILKHLKDPSGLKEFTLGEEQLRILESDLEPTKNYQEVFGYSEQLMTAIFYLIGDLYEQKEFAQCVPAMKFLILLYPYVPSYWTGLGNALLASGNQDEALKAFEMGVISGYQKINEIVETRKQRKQMKAKNQREPSKENSDEQP